MGDSYSKLLTGWQYAGFILSEACSTSNSDLTVQTSAILWLDFCNTCNFFLSELQTWFLMAWHHFLKWAFGEVACVTFLMCVIPYSTVYTELQKYYESNAGFCRTVRLVIWPMVRAVKLVVSSESCAQAEKVGLLCLRRKELSWSHSGSLCTPDTSILAISMNCML